MDRIVIYELFTSCLTFFQFRLDKVRVKVYPELYYGRFFSSFFVDDIDVFHRPWSKHENRGLTQVVCKRHLLVSHLSEMLVILETTWTSEDDGVSTSSVSVTCLITYTETTLFWNEYLYPSPVLNWSYASKWLGTRSDTFSNLVYLFLHSLIVF